MNLPQSIEALTQSRSGDSFAKKIVDQPNDLAGVYDLIRQKLSFAATKAFDEGVAFYKLSADEKTFLKNIIEFYIETMVKSINQAEINQETKDYYIQHFKSVMTYIEQIIDSLFTLGNNLIKEKKVIDINQISCNILGYAIETFRKNNISQP